MDCGVNREIKRLPALRRGGTFRYGMRVTGTRDDGSGEVPVTDADGMVFSSTVRTWPGLALVAELDVSGGADLVYTLHAADTSTWPIGLLCLDVLATFPSGDSISSPLAVFEMYAGATP